MVNVPSSVINAVKPYAKCPNAIWEGIVYYESGFNSAIVGDGPSVGGYSYGLFQLHVSTNGNGGQGNTALALIQQKTGLSGQAAVNYLLTHPDIQAQVGMPPINDAWNALKNSYDATSISWWLQFCSMSGHPGGNPQNPTTLAYVNNFLARVVKPNLFGIQQVQPGSMQASTSTPDNTWLQVLINMPSHQPCSVVWRRTCPGAKQANEGGMDLDSPNGTKVYALGSGHVIGAGYFWHPNGNAGYGVVTVRTAMPDGSLADVYYQHIQISPSIILCNQTGGQLYHNVVGPAPTSQPIQKGQLLGTVVVGEVEVGINADWGGVWGSFHPGPWVDDPEDAVRSLIDNGGGTSNTSLPLSFGGSQFNAFLAEAFENTSDAVHTLTSNPGLAGPIELFNDAQKFKPFAIPPDTSAAAGWPVIGNIESGISMPTRMGMGIIDFLLNNAVAFFIRSIFVILALVVMIALIINLVSNTTEQEIDEAGNLLPLIAEGAA